MNELPSGWVVTNLSMIADWGSGGTPSRRNAEFYGGNIPWIKTGELGARFVSEAEEYISEKGLENSSAKIFPKGSVAIAMYGATIGKTSILGIDTATNQACAVGRPKNDATTKEFLYYFLCSQRDNFIDAGKGGAQPNISQAVIKGWEIPLPPLAEQKRIADKLDTLLSKVEATRTRLNRIPQLLKHFRQSVLTAATTGQLTEDWREQQGLAGAEGATDTNYKNNVLHKSSQTRNAPFALDENDGWKEVTLPEIGEFGRGKSKHRPRNDPRLFGGNYPFIQTGDVANSEGEITCHSQTYTDFGLAQSKLWPKGTLCITIAANIADTAILGYPACFPDSVVGFVANKELCQVQFVKWSIDVIKSDLESFAPATAQKNINLGILSEIKFKLPPLKEQQEIIRRVEALFALADKIQARYQAAQAQVDKLTPALLAKAFQGKLLPQNPNDEPAGVLLEHIKAARSGETRKPRKTRME